MKSLLTRQDAPSVVGVIHLPPLPGAAGFDQFVLNHGDETQSPADRLWQWIAQDAHALIEGGVDGLIIENFNDTPFYPDKVPPVTVAAMTQMVSKVKQLADEKAFTGPIGVNVLRNDAMAGLAIACVTGSDFIRVNVLNGARLTDQGVITGQAATLLRERDRLRADHVQIWADVQVKHSTPLGPEPPLAAQVDELLHRAGADAVIVTGIGTGHATDLADLQEVRDAAGSAPVIVGSGVTPGNITPLIGIADAVIVGSSLKTDGQVANSVDPERVKALMEQLG